LGGGGGAGEGAFFIVSFGGGVVCGISQK